MCSAGDDEKSFICIISRRNSGRADDHLQRALACFAFSVIPEKIYEYFNNNNNNLFEKQQNEWFVPQIVTKLIGAGQDEYRNTLEN